jgi:hypothetical protein
VRFRSVIFVCAFSGLFYGHASAASPASREYAMKAAFLYNFIVFTEWPKEALPTADDPMVIGIIGQDPFGDAFESIVPAKGRKIAIKRFGGLSELKRAGDAEMARTTEAGRHCHLLFICISEAENISEILNMVKDASVLTVADTSGFLESGGMINLVVEEKKLRFEISNIAASKAGLKIGSQLLRLAKRVISDRPSPYD